MVLRVEVTDRRVEVIDDRGEDADTLFTRRELLARLEEVKRPLLEDALLAETLVTTLGRDAVRVTLLLELRVEFRTKVLDVGVVRDVRLAGALVITRGRDAVRLLPLVDTIRGVRDPASRGVVAFGRLLAMFLVADDVIAVLGLVVDRVLAGVRVSDSRAVLNVDLPTFRTSVRLEGFDAVRGGRWIRSRFRSISAFGSVRGTTDVFLVAEPLRAVAARGVADANRSELRP